MTIYTVHASSCSQKAKYENVEADTEKKDNFNHIVDIAHDLPKSNVLRRTTYEYNTFKYMQFYAWWTKNIVSFMIGLSLAYSLNI